MCLKRANKCQVLNEAFQRGLDQLPFYQKKANYPEFELFQNRKLSRFFWKVMRRTDYGRKLGPLGPLISAPARNVARANAAVIEYVVERSGAALFLDGSKSVADAGFMNNSGLFDFTPIHLSRDGRGHFLTKINYHRSTDPAEIVRNYKENVERIQEFLESSNRPFIRVKYEELCDKPEEELRRITAELGLDPAKASLAFRSVEQHGIGNTKFCASTDEQIINQELWKTDLSEEHLALFDRIAGDANRSLGYTD